jgi:hypothetical protein
MVDEDLVIQEVEGLTGVAFHPIEARNYPIPQERVKKFFYPTDPVVSRKKPFLHVIWIDVDDTVHIETEPLGDTMDMIEWIYGYEFYINRVRRNLAGIEKKAEVWAEFKQDFPPVAHRLLKYEVVVSELSKKHEIPLEMLYHGSEGLASFRIEARIGAERASDQRVINLAITALEEVYYKIAEHQRRLADAWGYLPARSQPFSS